MMEKNRKNAGFTLVEVLVAITIMALTGGILLSSFTVAIKLNARAEREYEACQQAQVVMEKLLCSDTLKTKVGYAIKNENVDLPSLVEEVTKTISVNKDDVKDDVPEIGEENVELASVVLSDYVAQLEGVKPTVLCTITVTIKDGESEVYQLIGQRRINLEGILSEPGGGAT